MPECPCAKKRPVERDREGGGKGHGGILKNTEFWSRRLNVQSSQWHNAYLLLKKEKTIQKKKTSRRLPQRLKLRRRRHSTTFSPHTKKQRTHPHLRTRQKSFLKSTAKSARIIRAHFQGLYKSLKKHEQTRTCDGGGDDPWLERRKWTAESEN